MGRVSLLASPAAEPPVAFPCARRAGIRGVNFSGGQRQRVNLARSAYCPSDLVLLDNALSAVDHHTAHHIFEHCILDMFKAQRKATVLITHQIEFVPQCDAVCIMDEGKVLHFGECRAPLRADGSSAVKTHAGALLRCLVMMYRACLTPPLSGLTFCRSVGQDSSGDPQPAAAY
jgi:hypothetical protein